MDPTRISIARILALDVPLTWQDAVAVVQEAAMLSDVNAAMNSRPSLVSPETCFITRAGDLELPDTTDVESPDAVADLLRAMLGDSEVPEALEALAYGPSTRDLSTDLAAFPIGNRRAAIARLATRALAVLAAPPARVEPVPIAPASVILASGAAVAPAWTPPERAPAPLPFPTPSAQIPPPFVASPRPAFVQPPPFTSAPTPPMSIAPEPEPAAAIEPTAERRKGPAPPAPDAELRRLRMLTVERALRNQRWSARLTRWVLWRPSFPDPRLLGGAAVVIAALVSMVWRPTPDGAGAARDVASAAPVATSATAPPSTASAGSSTGTSAPAAARDVPSSTSESDASGRPRAPRGATRAATADTDMPGAPAAPPATNERRAYEVAIGAPPPTTSVPPATGPPTPPTASTTTSLPGADTRGPAAPAAAGRGARARATYSANDAEVAPPVMLRQQLPSSLLEPDSEVPDDWPYLELLIDEQGAVERVRLRAKSLAPGQTLYRHRMLLAAAKAWQFEPALLNGQAVRYVMRVPLEP